MAVAARNLYPDGSQVITKGVQSGLPPNTLPRDQIAWMVNGTSRNCFLRQRPGWTRRVLSGDTISTGIFQGAALFCGNEELIVSRAGKVYAIDLSTYVVTELTTVTDYNSPILRRAWFCEAENFMLIQDGQSSCLIYDGALTFRASPSLQQVPTGTCMAYATGRLWVALPDGVSYVASDLVYSSSGTVAYGRRDAILYNTENQLYLGGGAFGVPFNAGKISAMVPVAQIDTSLGQGPLQIFTTSGAFSVNAPFDRALWSQINYPLQSVSMVGAGYLSDRAAVNVNGDIWGRSTDGVRSFQVARRDFGTWINAPFSQEAARAFENDDQSLLGWSSVARFDNRLLITCHPYADYSNGVVHRGLAVLDFWPLSGTSNRNMAPVWDGEWSGLAILQVVADVVNGQERCFILALNTTDDSLELWEVSRDSDYDNDGTTDRLITWQVEFGSYNWQDQGWGLKQLEFGDMWYDQLEDNVTFTLSYRPDQEPEWQSWHSWSSCAKSQTCDNVAVAGCSTQPPNLQPQYRVRKRFPQLSNTTCNAQTGLPYRRGFEFQPKLVIQGPCRLKKFRLWAGAVPEEPVGACADDTTCKTLDYCAPDILSYDSSTATARS